VKSAVLDLASLKSIEAFAASYGAGPLDILVLLFLLFINIKPRFE